MKTRSSPRRILAYGLPAIVLIPLLLFTFGKFLEIPYIGFDFGNSDGRILEVWAKNPAGQPILPGDKLLQVGSVTWSDYQTDLRQPLFEGMEPRDVVEIRLQRNGREITIPWSLPGPNFMEVLDRLNTIWLPYVFWLAGTATLILVRPRDLRWRLMIAFYYLTALWLMAGTLSTGVIWHSAIFLRMVIWLSVPVYLHLHWVFPRPLGRLPTGLLWAAYFGAAIVAGLEWFQVLPPPLYLLGFFMALVGSLVLLVVHGIVQPDQRRNLKLLGAAILLIVIPTLLIGTIASTLLAIPPLYAWAALLSLPAIPAAYFYVIYRRQLGGLELRANRIISAYAFLILLFTVSSILLIFAITAIENRSILIVVEAVLAILAGLAGALLFPGFQRLVERRFLGMPLPPTQLLETHAARITTSLDLADLVALLQDEILPSLLVRQSALLQVNEEGFITPIYAAHVPEGQLPAKADAESLAARSGRYLRPGNEGGIPEAWHWVRLVLALEMGGRLNGLWLLGRRDPDDYYAPSEIPVLQAIANQTAIALANIAHADLLHALYQADIERQEEERAALARGLHDEVLNQLAAVFLRQPAAARATISQETEEVIADYLRDVINGLRPAMLNYGLGPAIDELVDHLSERAEVYTTFEVNIRSGATRYDPSVEQHVFRILQQACENALRHAQARSIRIAGELQPVGLRLAVKDDGTGFPAGDGVHLEEWLRLGHYGLVGMHERAAIIGANLQIQSQPGQGTRVEVVWEGRSEAG